VSRDPRYGTSAWRRARKRVLAEAGYVCELRTSPRCTGHASTVHHLNPTSQGGDFFARENLCASCAPCNYRHGQALSMANRGQTKAELWAIIELEMQTIRILRERLAKYEPDDDPAAPIQAARRPRPAVY
jgi:hypothetical protein